MSADHTAEYVQELEMGYDDLHAHVLACHKLLLDHGYDGGITLDGDTTQAIGAVLADIARLTRERDAAIALAEDAIRLAVDRRQGCPVPCCLACARQEAETGALFGRLVDLRGKGKR